MRIRAARRMGDLAITHKANEQSAREHHCTSQEEDQMTLSQFIRSEPDPKDSFLLDKLNMDLDIKTRKQDPKLDTKRVGPDTPRISEGYKRKREVADEPYDHSEVQSSAVLERAKGVLANLAPEYPSFIKLMLRSHVTKGFWLGLPSEFCKLHLPKHDETIILEGENGEYYEANFLFYKGGLSGGWRGFSLAHKLLEGDVVVFHLVQPCKFKVYIIRANGLAEIDGALGLLNLDLGVKEIGFGKKEKVIRRCKKTEERHLRLPQPAANIQKSSMTIRHSDHGPASDQSENGTEELSSNDIEEFVLSSSLFGLENFKIIANGLIIDCELPKHIRAKYYELCCTQRAYLHNQLLKNINSKLAAGIISETVNIADAIRACKRSTFIDGFSIWGKTLEAFEVLGMKVGFLRARLSQLVNLAFESTESGESERHKEARLERDRAEDEMRSLNIKLLELKQAKVRLDDDMETLKADSRRCELIFQEQLDAPW